MRILICGGQTLNPNRVADYLYWHLQPMLESEFNPIERDLWPSHVISGKAPGGDRGGELWAEQHHVPVLGFPKEDFPNPFERNRQMILRGLPHVGIAFPGNSGTANMIGQLRACNIPVILVKGDFK